MSFLPVAEIGEMAQRLVLRLARAGALDLPISAEWVAEGLLDLAIEWTPLPVGEEGAVLAGLDVRRRVLALNEVLRPEFARTPGLERFSIAHEVGHWMLHVDLGVLGQAPLPGFDAHYPFLCRGDTEGQREWQADQFAAALLMPRDLVRDAIGGLDLGQWPDRYRLRARFGVSISALTRRLRDMGIGFVRDGKIHRSREEAHGQAPLFDP